MHASFVIARRFLYSSIREKNLATMLLLCALSTFMSIAAFTLMSAIMNGFQETTIKALQGIHSDVTFEAPSGAQLSFEKINRVLTKEFSHIIDHATPIALEHAIIQTTSKNDISNVVLIQGIQPERDAQTRAWNRMIKRPNISLPLALYDNQIILGTRLADDLQVQPGDVITLLVAVGEDDTLSFKKTDHIVGALFATGIDDFDRTVVFCSLATFQTLLPETGITQIGIKLKPYITSQLAIQALKQRFSFPLYAWQELYPALLEGLALERFALFVILLLVGIMTSINSMALLLMYCAHHRKTIAIFFVMGMPLRSIRLVFTLISMTITLLSTLAGLLTAAGISWLLETYQLITLPTVYYTNYVPAILDGTFVILVFVVMILISSITSWWATGRIQKMNIAEILKGN
jgi:ABC-type lipoprotein release transport system permease subunit